ncbi:MAG: DNA (cytosine-5-)-methyltransferase [Methanobrevibacter sp. CfCl-M3]
MIKIEENYKNSLDKIKFIDLFCGIGGFRLALESFGAECVYSIDIDKHACSTYKLNFGDYPLGDITKEDVEKIPYHDILCAGFPCQAFSISGKQKGFDDTRGNLFFDIARIVGYHKPKILLLENVKNLKKHDKGNTFRTIKNTLNELEYNVYFDIINASKYDIPQSRERIYLICIRKDLDNHNFHFPQQLNVNTSLNDILIDENECEEYIINKKYVLDEKKIKKYKKIAPRPLRVGTVNKGGQGDRIYLPNGHAITLSAEGGGTGAKTGLYLVNNVVRKLHPRETARLMGFPDSFKFNPSVSQSHKQFGNSVIINIIQYLIKKIVDDGSIYNG